MITIHFAIFSQSEELGLRVWPYPTPQGGDLNSLGWELLRITHGTDLLARRLNAERITLKKLVSLLAGFLDCVYMANSMNSRHGGALPL